MPLHHYSTRLATALRQHPPPHSQHPQRASSSSPMDSSIIKSTAVVEMKEEQEKPSRKRVRSELGDERDEKDSHDCQSKLQEEEESDNESLFTRVPLSPLFSSEPSTPLAFSSSPVHSYSLSLPNSPRSHAPSPFPSSSSTSTSPSLSNLFLSDIPHSDSSSTESSSDTDITKPPRKRPRLYIHIPEDEAPSTWTQKYPPLLEETTMDKSKVEFAGLPCFDEADEKNMESVKNDEERSIIGPYSLKDYLDPRDLQEELHRFPALPVAVSPAPLVFNAPVTTATLASSTSASSSTSSSSSTFTDIFSHYDWVVAASFPPVDITSSPFLPSASSLSSSVESDASALPVSAISVIEENAKRFELVCTELNGIECHSLRLRDGR